MNLRCLLLVSLSLLASVSWVSADERALIEKFNGAIKLIEAGKFDEAQRAIDALSEELAKVPKGDDAYNRARQLLQELPRLKQASHHRAANQAFRRRSAALAEVKFADAIAANKRAIAELTALDKLSPDDKQVKQELVKAREHLARAELVVQPSSRKPAELELLLGRANLPKAAEIFAHAPEALLPRCDKAGLVSLREPKASAVVIQLFKASDDSARLARGLMDALQRTFGQKGVRLVSVAFDRGEDAAIAALETSIKKDPPLWPVAYNDGGEFSRLYLASNFYLPSYVVITPDGRALRISLGDPVTATAKVVDVLLGEMAKPASEKTIGPVSWHPPAEPFAGIRVGGPGVPEVVLAGGKPRLLLIAEASAGLEARDELSALATDDVRKKVDLAAAIYGTPSATAADWAAGWGFPVWRIRDDLPACYGRNYAARLVLLSARGRVVKTQAIPRDAVQRKKVLEVCLAALATANAIPPAAHQPLAPNLVARSAGGAARWANGEGKPLDLLIDGALNRDAWQSPIPVDVAFSFLNGEPATFDRLVLDNLCNLGRFEVLAGDRMDGDWRSLGLFHRASRDSVQAFALPPTTARFVKLRVLSTMQSAPLALREIVLEEASNAAPNLPRRLASGDAPQRGLDWEFPRDNIALWQPIDFGRTRHPASWLVGPQGLQVADATSGVDFRAVGLLSPHAPVADFHIRLEAQTDAEAAGVLWGFQDWNNFDRLLLIKGSTQSSRGNSIRLERWRGGKLQVQAIHGERFPFRERLELEIFRQGATVAVKASGQWLFRVEVPNPLPGKIGLCGAGKGRFATTRFSVATQIPADVVFPEEQILSTAAGASIVWLSDQSGFGDATGWASNLLRPAVFGPAGHWVARPLQGVAPEVVFGFRDLREVELEQVGFALPELPPGEADALVRKVEVLVARDGVLNQDSFRSLGAFALTPGAERQWIRLSQPATCRYLAVRLLENGEAETFALARVFARGRFATPSDVAARIETEIAGDAALSEREPNDELAQATPLAEDRWLKADVRTGSTDWFRVPLPPGSARDTLRVQIQAVPWLRLKAFLTNAAGEVLPPPLADLSTGQESQQTRVVAGDAEPPAFLRVEMPAVDFGLVVDTSDSMGGREADLRAAVRAYVEGADESESIEVLRFGDRVETVGRLPGDKAALRDAIDRLATSGNTALYQALLRGIQNKQAVILFSDGQNTILNGAGFTDLCRALRRRPTAIYTIGVGRDLYEFDANSANTAIGLLRNLARATGGRFAFAPESDELTTLYQNVAADVRRTTAYRLRASWETKVEPHLTLKRVFVPQAATANDSVKVSWTVEATRGDQERIISSDGVYLSVDNVLDDSDTRLGVKKWEGALAAGNQYRHSLLVSFSGVAPGRYHVIVNVNEDDPQKDIRGPDKTGSGSIHITKALQLSAFPDSVEAELRVGTSQSGRVAVRNLNPTDVKNLRARVIQGGQNIDLQVEMPAALAAGESGELAYTVTAKNDSVLQGRTLLAISDSERVLAEVAIDFQVAPQRPSLTASPARLECGLTPGLRGTVECEVLNAGSVAARDLQLEITSPSWLRPYTPTSIEQLDPGRRTTIGLAANPPPDLPVGTYSGVIHLVSPNAKLAIPYEFTVVAKGEGDLHVSATDEYTYFAKEMPKVEGATVRLTAPSTGEIVAEGTTDREGLFAAKNIPQGRYNLQVSADNHATFSAAVTIAPGQTIDVEAFLQRHLVTYQWTVEPSEIQDRYQITLDALFETHVPAPVVTVDPIQPVFLLDDQPVKTAVRITNHGLIAAQGVRFPAVEGEEVVIEPLIQDIGTLPALTSVLVPVEVRYKPGEKESRRGRRSIKPRLGPAAPCALLRSSGDTDRGGGSSCPWQLLTDWVARVSGRGDAARR